MDHDGLFKALLTTFFFEFMQLFFSEIAAEMVRESIEFLDKEILTDLVGGKRHEVDLLVKVKFRSGKESFFLIHVEHQSSPQEDFGRRMFKYFIRLFVKYDLPIFPVVVCQRRRENPPNRPV